jgi:hypothetical protein
MKLPDYTPRPDAPREPPATPWYERRGTKLSAEEIDDYDRQMAPQRVKRAPKLFL